MWVRGIGTCINPKCTNIELYTPCMEHKHMPLLKLDSFRWSGFHSCIEPGLLQSCELKETTVQCFDADLNLHE